MCPLCTPAGAIRVKRSFKTLKQYEILKHSPNVLGVVCIFLFWGGTVVLVYAPQFIYSLSLTALSV